MQAIYRWVTIIFLALILYPNLAFTAPQIEAIILIQDSSLAGFHYYEGRKVWDMMHLGDTLDLVHEPDNSHDSNAVRVEWQGHKLGYIPRNENAAIARMLDQGEKIKARIVKLQKNRSPSKRIEFEIYMTM